LEIDGTENENVAQSKRCLALAGATFHDVVKINYYVKDLSYTEELRRVRAIYLDIDIHQHPRWCRRVLAVRFFLK